VGGTNGCGRLGAATVTCRDPPQGRHSSLASHSSLEASSHSHTDFSSDEDGGMYYLTTSPSKTLPYPSLVCGDTGDDEEGDIAGVARLPKDLFYSRRRSLTIAIPGANTAGDSSTTVGREREGGQSRYCSEAQSKFGR
jgi:hypothetical protein